VHQWIFGALHFLFLSFEASSVKEIIRQTATNKTPIKIRRGKKKKKETTIYYSVHSNKTRHHIDAQNGLSSCARESRRRRQIARQKKLAPSSFSRAQKVIDREALFFFVGERKGRDFLFESDQSIHHGVRFKIGPRNGGIIVIFEATGAAAATTDELRSRHFERCREVDEQQRAKRRRRYVSPLFFSTRKTMIFSSQRSACRVVRVSCR